MECKVINIKSGAPKVAQLINNSGDYVFVFYDDRRKNWIGVIGTEDEKKEFKRTDDAPGFINNLILNERPILISECVNLTSEGDILNMHVIA